MFNLLLYTIKNSLITSIAYAHFHNALHLSLLTSYARLPIKHALNSSNPKHKPQPLFLIITRLTRIQVLTTQSIPSPWFVFALLSFCWRVSSPRCSPPPCPRVAPMSMLLSAPVTVITPSLRTAPMEVTPAMALHTTVAMMTMTATMMREMTMTAMTTRDTTMTTMMRTMIMRMTTITAPRR